MSRPIKNAKKILSYRSAVENLDASLEAFFLALANKKLELEQIRELKRLEKRVTQVFQAAYASNQQTGKFA